MSRVFVLSVAFWTGSTLGAQEPSALEKASQRLDALLTPQFKSTGGAALDAARPMRTTRPMPLPGLPLPQADLPPPALPLPSSPALRPRPALEDVPLVNSFHPPQPPIDIEFATAPLVRLWSWDREAALPVPILNQTSSERASLADPTLAASVAAALPPVAISREQPTPFEPLNLPDPFEHKSTMLRLGSPAAEQPAPPLAERPLSAR